MIVIHLSLEELQALNEFLAHQYISYDDLDLMSAVRTIIEAREHDYVKIQGIPFPVRVGTILAEDMKGPVNIKVEVDDSGNVTDVVATPITVENRPSTYRGYETGQADLNERVGYPENNTVGNPKVAERMKLAEEWFDMDHFLTETDVQQAADRIAKKAKDDADRLREDGTTVDAEEQEGSEDKS